MIEQQIWDKINEYDKVTILTHIRPDGDTIGTAIALKHLILDNLENKTVKISGDKYPKFLNKFETNDDVSDEFFNDSIVIVVDTSSKKRIWDQRVVTEESIKIDHHHHEEEWLLGIGGDKWPATGQLLVEIAMKLNLKISRTAAEAMFLAIYTDTAGFTQRNITQATYDAVEFLNLGQEGKDKVLKMIELPEEDKVLLESVKKDIVWDDKFGYLIHQTNVPDDIRRPFTEIPFQDFDYEVYIVICPNDGRTGVSLRSKGNYDVSEVCKHFGGGGHLNSCGFNGQIDKAMEYVEYTKAWYESKKNK